MFQTQIETAYFLYAFPLLQGNFEVYHLVVRGAISSAIFVLLVTLIVGGFSRKPRRPSQFTVTADHAVTTGAWLAAVYVLLYILFGYFVAWQSQELRIFYGGPAVLNTFADQMRTTLMSKPELPFFQYFRGVVWILCLLPLFKGFTGGRLELVLLSAFALGLLPTAQLALPNPLMVERIPFRRGEMELAYMGEITTPSRCGRMDQGCAFGTRPVLMTFDGDRLDTSELRISQDIHFVIVDLQGQKDTMEILNRLNRCYPVPQNPVERGVQDLLGTMNKRIVFQAVDALQDSDGRVWGN